MMKIYNFVCIYIFGQWKATVVNVGPNFTTKCHIIRKWGFLVFGSLQIFGSKRKRGGGDFWFLVIWVFCFWVYGFGGKFFLYRAGNIFFGQTWEYFVLVRGGDIFGGFGFSRFLVFGSLQSFRSKGVFTSKRTTKEGEGCFLRDKIIHFLVSEKQL
jgi:hypothetical protein